MSRFENNLKRLLQRHRGLLYSQRCLRRFALHFFKFYRLRDYIIFCLDNYVATVAIRAVGDLPRTPTEGVYFTF